MSDNGYQGWANYPTWAVALWINNEQGWQESVHAELRDLDVAFPGGPTDPREIDRALTYRAGEIISASVDERIAFETTGDPDGTFPAGLSSDLLMFALGQVDWRELGASFLTDLAEQDQS